jgi:SecD/SecF fusion protein
MLAAAFYETPLTLFFIGLALMGLFFWYFATDSERRQRNIGTVLIIGVVALCVAATLPFKEKLKGGIDIVGGSSFSLKIKPRQDANGNDMAVTKEQVDQAITILEKRLNSMGTAEPLLVRQGEDGILLQMAGVKPEESARIRQTLVEVAKLELREVSPRNNEPGLAERVASKQEVVPGYKAFTMKHKSEDGVEISTPILINNRAALGGSDIAVAYASQQQSDAVEITLNSGGTDKMIALTQKMRPQADRIAIILNGEVISAPVVNQVPLGKNFQITGLSEPGEAKKLASSLMNPLENPLTITEGREVSPTLGEAVVKQGLTSGALALAVTFLFVLIYYRVSGFIAIIGLIINTIMLFGIMAMFGSNFTIPGIAGMVLTIGMAVDANVLIYERLREEMAHGKSLKNALEASYDRAFPAIFDSHFTSLLTAGILFWLGTSVIKGFAITLLIGVTASLFSAVLVTRVIFRWGIDIGLFKKLSFLDLIKSHSYDFMGKRRIAITLAIITLIASLGAFAIKREKALGVDFTGGTMVKFQVGKDSSVTLEDVRKTVETLRPQLSKEAYTQQESNPLTGKLITVRCDSRDSTLITSKLRESIPALGVKNEAGEHKIGVSQDQVSAIIGGGAMKDALLAITCGLIGIVIYLTFRYEFSFALGGFIAIFHDIIICVGIVVMLGQELSMIHVGAILTIAGYSISDTIIVFDRIRETLLHRNDSVVNIMNDAVNATLSRTLLTSGATLISVVILALLGGGSDLFNFGFIIGIGIIVGTFSSIFIASPVVLWWSNRKGGNIRDAVLTSAAKAEAVAAAP